MGIEDFLRHRKLEENQLAPSLHHFVVFVWQWSEVNWVSLPLSSCRYGLLELLENAELVATYWMDILLISVPDKVDWVADFPFPFLVTTVSIKVGEAR